MLTKIDPNKEYTLVEIIDLKLIPDINGYASIYNLVTEKKPSSANRLGFRKEIAKITTGTSIKGIHDGKPWNKISGKIRVEGSEIIKFLKITKLI